MHKPQAQVREFHRDVTNQPISPTEPQLRTAELRAKLILEEALETVVALVGSKRATNLLENAAYDAKLFSVTHSSFAPNDNPEDIQLPNLIEVIDGLCDTIVVCYGTAEVIGIDIEPFFDEVMRSNMAKIGGPIREDGKMLKPPGWTPPDIAGVLAKVQK